MAYRRTTGTKRTRRPSRGRSRTTYSRRRTSRRSSVRNTRPQRLEIVVQQVQPTQSLETILSTKPAAAMKKARY